MLEVLQIIILVLPLMYAFKQLKYLTFVSLFTTKVDVLYQVSSFAGALGQTKIFIPYYFLSLGFKS